MTGQELCPEAKQLGTGWNLHQRREKGALSSQHCSPDVVADLPRCVRLRQSNAASGRAPLGAPRLQRTVGSLTPPMLRSRAMARAAWLERSATLKVDRDNLRLAVVADTHSTPHAELHAQLAALAPDAILHAGDIGDLSVLQGLTKLAPLFAIRGNIDVRAADLPDALTLDVVRAGNEGLLLRLLLVHIALRAVRLQSDVLQLARQRAASLVVCGHSHIPFVGKDRGMSVFNPGSCGPRRFLLPIVFGVMDVSTTGVRYSHRDCETGSDWAPPAFPRLRA